VSIRPPAPQGEGLEEEEEEMEMEKEKEKEEGRRKKKRTAEGGDGGGREEKKKEEEEKRKGHLEIIRAPQAPQVPWACRYGCGPSSFAALSLTLTETWQESWGNLCLPKATPAPFQTMSPLTRFSPRVVWRRSLRQGIGKAWPGGCAPTGSYGVYRAEDSGLMGSSARDVS
jgi:hypothetical protein